MGSTSSSIAQCLSNFEPLFSNYFVDGQIALTNEAVPFPADRQNRKVLGLLLVVDKSRSSRRASVSWPFETSEAASKTDNLFSCKHILRSLVNKMFTHKQTNVMHLLPSRKNERIFTSLVLFTMCMFWTCVRVNGHLFFFCLLVSMSVCVRLNFCSLCLFLSCCSHFNFGLELSLFVHFRDPTR